MAGTVKADVIQSELGTPTVFRNSAGTEIGTICRSWVNFNGVSGSVAVRASFNVSSVTRGGTAGYYLIAFSTSMADGSHVTNANAQPNNYGGAYAGCGDTAAGTQIASRASLELRDANNASTDSNYVQVSVHR